MKTTTSLKYTDSKATLGKTWVYRVRAVMSDGTKGMYSQWYGVTATLGTPKVTGSLNAKGKPTLTWKAVAGAAEYQIWRSTTGEPGSFKLVTNVTDTSWTHTKASAGKTYYYQVRAVSAYGLEGVFSSTVTLTVK